MTAKKRIHPPAHSFSKIKDIWLEVANPGFVHRHLGEEKADFFLGRKKAKERLKTLLTRSQSPSGAYLVTGFRGMGKTSLVHEVIREIAPIKHYKTASISLSQDDIRDLDVLRLIARQLHQIWRQNHLYFNLWRSSLWILLGFALLIGMWLSPLTIDCFPLYLLDKPFCDWPKYSTGIFLTASGVLTFALLLIRMAPFLFRPQQTYRNISKRLSFLNSRLDATVTLEMSNSMSSRTGATEINQGSKNTRSFPVATAKDIEKELIDILNDIHQYRQHINFFKSLKEVPEFVFILDELDKIEPEFIVAPAQSSADSHLATISRNAQRRDTIDRLLSSMKSFLNEAKAKFIFIGGREMYDAALADIADRETFYGSIFHAVIYINSFFKDKIQHRSGISRLTEAYLCHMLIPDWYLEPFIEDYYAKHPNEPRIDHDEWYSLDTLYHYLIDAKNSRPDQEPNFKYWNARLQITPETYGEREAAYKIIYLLQNYIIFLTYRSSGTPKKLAVLLESNIVNGSADRTPGHGYIKSYLYDESHANDLALFIPQVPTEKTSHPWWKTNQTRTPAPSAISCEGRLFLKFNFNLQYEIGLTSNLYRPYVIIHSRHMKALGDKLLFSSTYIMDYILKFHPHGFSWRNLEMVPDIILTNKDPNLRAFMQELVQFLSRMYIRETINGMFQYRFFSKVINEIRFLSKISEQGAAAFNFTLDESQQIKHYYRSKLHEQIRQHQEPIQFREGESPYIHSIAFLHNLLGDLHYFDKEYDDAIIHYSDGSKALRERVKSGGLSRHQVVLLVRTQLKLGMALEKIRAFDSAYSIYRSLIADTPALLTVRNDATNEQGEDMTLSRMQLLVRPHIALLDLIEKQRIDGITYLNLTKNLSELNILLDKGRPYPMFPTETNQDQYDIEKTDQARLNTLYSDYFNNVGSVLYFKNMNYPQLYDVYHQGNQEAPGLKELKYNTLAGFMTRYRGNNDHINYDYNPSLSAYLYYRQAIREQVQTFRDQTKEAIRQYPADKESKLTLEGLNDLQEAILMLHPATGYQTNSMQLFLMGNLFSKLGDAMLSSAGPDVQPLNADVIKLYEGDDTQENIVNLLSDCQKWLGEDNLFDNALNTSLMLFRVSGLFYLKANRSFSCAFQFKKFLFTIKDWLAFFGRAWLINEPAKLTERCRLLTRLETLLVSDEPRPGIASRLLRSIVWSADVANRPQLMKYREILNLERQQDTFSIYNNISTSAEMREVVLLIEDIRLKIRSLADIAENLNGATQELLNLEPLSLNMVSPYDSIYSKYLRIIELRFKCEYNFALVKSIGYSAREGEKSGAFCAVELLQRNDFKKNDSDYLAGTLAKLSDKQQEGLEARVLDSIFCLYEVIRSLNIYGINYITNHSFLANAHYKLANWCRAYYNLRMIRISNAGSDELEKRKAGQEMDQKLIQLLGTDALYALEPNYHCEQALEHYYAAMQTHKGGRSYRDNVTNLSFLEDDLNDNLTHFSAATERFRINTGVIRDKIKSLKREIKNSQVYDYWSYVEV
ncbi:MAG: ATP-binding protein [Saprospiraceae bacterium]|nr:ATP-binding protein [Saprospiraceae bacterium]